MKDVIIIYGPTAVGKSAVAVELAKRLNGEIISADSMQIYKHLNIGSAKVTKEEMQGIPHHLLDFLEPNEEYSASQFVHDALCLCEDIISRKKTPIIVGGTGLYINGLIKGFNFGNTSKNSEFRKSLDALSNTELYEKILTISPNSQIDKNNRRRLVRELEKINFGEPTNNSINTHYNFRLFALIDDRTKIYDRINLRVDKMIKEGLLEEAKLIYSLNLPDDALAIKAIGYKELFPYIKQEATLDECASILKQKTRNYAKRQFTYMNQFEDLIKVEFCGVSETASKIIKLLEDKEWIH